jgi:omega-amidase
MADNDRKGGNILKIFLSRWLATSPDENLKRADAEMEEASSLQARIVVFPELFLTGYKEIVEPGRARDHFSKLSLKYPEMLVLFGTISEEKRNRATMWHKGREILRYDKVHLFLPGNEDDLWDPGENYSAADTEFGKIGVAVCNDIRFPEVARSLKLDQKIDLLLVPAWWPWRRNGIWKDLLKARAVENAVYCAGCCVASAETSSEKFYGAGNYIFDPQGREVETKDDRTYEITLPFPGEILVDPSGQDIKPLESKLFSD